LRDETGWHHGETNGCGAGALRINRTNTYTTPKIANASVVSLAVIRPSNVSAISQRVATAFRVPRRKGANFTDMRRRELRRRGTQ